MDAQISLGSASSFGIVATSAITSTGLSVIVGELGISPNGLTSITGFPPGISGSQHGADATAQTAHSDAMTAYTALAALQSTTSLTGQDLGGKTLNAGVYNFASSAGLTGILTLDGQNNASAQFVFQMGSTITTATASAVILINGAQPCNVFWQVGSSATLGTGTTFAGSILAYASVTVNSACTVQGGLYALTAAVTLIDDAITAPGVCAAAAPAPTSATSSNPSTASASVVSASTAPSGMRIENPGPCTVLTRPSRFERSSHSHSDSPRFRSM